ncbi:unnamed protein product [Urochloa humidicola]
MHLLHRSSMFGGGGFRSPRRGAAVSPRAPPLPRRQQLFSKSDSIKKRAPPASKHHLLFSRSDSIKKRSGAATKGSKRARLRAGIAAALQDLKLAGFRYKGGSSAVLSSAATRTTRLGEPHQVGLQVPAAAAASSWSGSPEGTTAGGGGALLLVLFLVALLCVVALGRSPAVCCCTSAAAWWCRGTSAAATGRRQAPPPEWRAQQVQVA